MLIAIDPGLNGWVVAGYWENNYFYISKSFSLARFFKSKNILSPHLFIPFIVSGSMVVVEKVWGRPRDGGSRAFNFGFLNGQIRFALEISGVPWAELSPQKWRSIVGNEFGVRAKGKRLSNEIVKQLGWTPNSHDEADAICLAVAYLIEEGKKVEGIGLTV